MTEYPFKRTIPPPPIETITEPGALESGFVTTGANGRAEISFAETYATKPNLQLTPEFDPATETVYPQIVSWTTDAAGNYIGAVIQTSDDGGKAEAGVLVHWAIF